MFNDKSVMITGGSGSFGQAFVEKLHEIMCPVDDCHLTLEFADHYVIFSSDKAAIRSSRRWRRNA